MAHTTLSTSPEGILIKEIHQNQTSKQGIELDLIMSARQNGECFHSRDALRFIATLCTYFIKGKHACHKEKKMGVSEDVRQKIGGGDTKPVLIF